MGLKAWRRPQVPAINKRRQLFTLLALSLLLFLFLATPIQRYLSLVVFRLESHESHTLPSSPPTYERLRKWEHDLPQHNLDLPYPEGRHGRYVKFTNQIKMLGWNNVFNEV